MGKYSHLRSKLEPFTEEASYQSLIDEKKQELLGTLDADGANVNRLAALVVKIEREKKALYERYQSKDKTDAEYEIQLYKTALSQLFVSACMAEGISEVRLQSGELISLDDKAILTIKDKPKAIEWALKHVPELLTVSYKGLTKKQLDKLAEWGEKNKLTINVTLDSNTLKALGRDNALQGKPTPAGMGLFLLTQAKAYGLNGDKSAEE